MRSYEVEKKKAAGNSSTAATAGRPAARADTTAGIVMNVDAVEIAEIAADLATTAASDTARMTTALTVDVAGETASTAGMHTQEATTTGTTAVRIAMSDAIATEVQVMQGPADTVVTEAAVSAIPMREAELMAGDVAAASNENMGATDQMQAYDGIATLRGKTSAPTTD